MNTSAPNIKTVCTEVRSFLAASQRLAAIRYVRRWLVQTGRGDSYTRAVNLIADVQHNFPWTR